MYEVFGVNWIDSFNMNSWSMTEVQLEMSPCCTGTTSTMGVVVEKLFFLPVAKLWVRTRNFRNSEGRKKGSKLIADSAMLDNAVQ